MHHLLSQAGDCRTPQLSLLGLIVCLAYFGYLKKKTVFSFILVHLFFLFNILVHIVHSQIFCFLIFYFFTFWLLFCDLGQFCCTRFQNGLCDCLLSLGLSFSSSLLSPSVVGVCLLVCCPDPDYSGFSNRPRRDNQACMLS